MATTTPIPTPTTPIAGEHCITLRGVDWSGYRAMLRVRGERAVPKMVYLDGDLWLMSPSSFHESLAERLGSFVIEVAVGMGIPYIPAGHTTFRRLKKRGGVEADKSYYFANERQVRGKEKIDLRNDPPPDLVIEAIHTDGVEASIEVWRRFRVPEIWVCDAASLRIIIRQANGRYAESEISANLPFLPKVEIFEWVRRLQTTSDLEWSRDVRRWVQDVLVPRVGGQGGDVRESGRGPEKS